MSIFARQFKRTGGGLLLRQFGDRITYYARSGATGRQVQAMIERDQQLIDGVPVPGQPFVVRVLNDSHKGISATEIDTGGDEISVPLRVGEDAERRSIVQVISTENGMVRFMVQ